MQTVTLSLRQQFADSMSKLSCLDMHYSRRVMYEVTESINCEHTGHWRAPCTTLKWLRCRPCDVQICRRWRNPATWTVMRSWHARCRHHSNVRHEFVCIVMWGDLICSRHMVAHHRRDIATSDITVFMDESTSCIHSHTTHAWCECDCKLTRMTGAHGRSRWRYHRPTRNPC